MYKPKQTSAEFLSRFLAKFFTHPWPLGRRKGVTPQQRYDCSWELWSYPVAEGESKTQRTSLGSQIGGAANVINRHGASVYFWYLDERWGRFLLRIELWEVCFVLYKSAGYLWCESKLQRSPMFRLDFGETRRAFTGQRLRLVKKFTPLIPYVLTPAYFVSSAENAISRSRVVVVVEDDDRLRVNFTRQNTK